MTYNGSWIKEYGPPGETLAFGAEAESGRGSANTIAVNSTSHAKSETQPYSLGNSDLLASYNTYFRSEEAETPEFMNIAFALRYQVYCLEREFERAGQHTDRLERDEFDSHALHNLLYFRPTEEAIGTVRLILPDHGADSLPIQTILRENGLNAEDYFPIEDTGEVSRFAISNEFRRGTLDKTTPGSLTKLADKDRPPRTPWHFAFSGIIPSSYAEVCRARHYLYGRRYGAEAASYVRRHGYPLYAYGSSYQSSWPQAANRKLPAGNAG